MSSSDQAKSKLLDSMRMSKQGSTPDVTTPETKAKPSAKSSEDKSGGTNKKSKSEKKSSAPEKPITDNFQRARRVWPD